MNSTHAVRLRIVSASLLAAALLLPACKDDSNGAFVYQADGSAAAKATGDDAPATSGSTATAGTDLPKIPTQDEADAAAAAAITAANAEAELERLLKEIEQDSKDP
ncbi:MAG: hypothetical protein ACT4PU_05985 [Planctomycetota bacterium]